MRLSPRYAIALIAAAGLFPVALDSTIVNVAIVPISRALQSDIATIQWIFIGYLLANAAMVPLSGYLGNRFGTKRLFLLGLALFTLFSLLSGLAPSEQWLVTFRVLQGLGGGLLLPLAMAVGLRPFAQEERARAMAAVGLPALLAPVVGPIIGGLILDRLTWPSIFFVNVPLGLLVLALAWRVLPTDAREPHSAEAPRGFDYLGLLLSMAAVTLLVYAFKLVSQTAPRTRPAMDAQGMQGMIYGWGYWPVWALIAGGVALLAAFTYQALRVSRDPVLDLRLFARLEFAVANLTLWLGAIITFGLLFLLPVYLQQVRLPHLSPLQTGLALLPMGLATLVGMTLAAGLYRLVGARPLVLGGVVLLGLGYWQFRGLTPTTSIAALVLPLALVGLGVTLLIAPTLTLALEALSGDALNKASSLVNATRLLWGSLGSAALVTTYIQDTLTQATRLEAALPVAVLAHPTGAAAQAARAQLAAQAATSGLVDVFTLLLWGTLALAVVAVFLPGRRTVVTAEAGAEAPTIARTALVTAAACLCPGTAATLCLCRPEPDLFGAPCDAVHECIGASASSGPGAGGVPTVRAPQQR